MWLAGSLWTLFLIPELHYEVIIITILDSIVFKSLIWVVPFFLMKKMQWKELFGKPFPWLACLVFICITVAFLHTLRLLNGLQNTHLIFDPMIIVFSLSAGVLEELSFRGGFFAWQEHMAGFWPAAILNGVIFTMYHFPELLLGQWQGLISFRGGLIFMMGIVFCWMYKRWKNIALNMTVHTVWDIICYIFCLT